MAEMEATRQQLGALNAELLSMRVRNKNAAQLLEEATSLERRTKLRLDAIITRFAKKECLQLTDLMYRKLPAELRDAVYQYLCIEDQTMYVGPYYHFRPYECKPTVKVDLEAEWRQVDYHVNPHMMFDFDPPSPEIVDAEEAADRRIADVPEQEKNFITLPDGRAKYDHTCQRPTGVLLPNNHIFNPEYVGDKVAWETQQLYWAQNTFSICHVDAGIERLLQKAKYTGFQEESLSGRLNKHEDRLCPWGFVHDLQIRIKFEHFRQFLKFAMEHQRPTTAESFAYERNFLRAIKESLEPLVRLPLSTRTLNIEFILMTQLNQDDEDERRTFGNLLQAIRNTIYRLVYDRPNTCVKIVHHDELMSPFPRDITQLWSLTKEQWEHEKAANHDFSGTADWTEEFYFGDLFIRHNGRFGGYFNNPQLWDVMMAERWGIGNVYEDTKPRTPIKEGLYWPVYTLGSGDDEDGDDEMDS
ncbi:hypothetical protein CC86DRAFT_375805 [Ophiobolus disseminans]|uniref:Uncharacterized protein n=1 Tax=Ophiobolus disseminans TaxID=1469910 RepID=A0A6A6ZC82_9PLEO|nr:hypothetical protein CC86DRAFT_375805 [Ophiobolus disseminans]